MKMKKTLIMLALAGAVGSASAADYWFDHSSTPGDDLWSSVGNWNLSGLPGPGDNVFLYPNTGAAGGLSQVDVTSTVASLNWFSGNQQLEILPTGNLTVGAMSWPGIGNAASEDQTLTLSGGSLDVDANGTSLIFGDFGSGTLNMNSGLLKVRNGGLYMGAHAGSGNGYMTGGTMDLGSLTITVDGSLEVTAGTIIIRGGGDQTGILPGQITLTAGSSISLNSFDGTDTTMTVIPETATLGLFSVVGGGILWMRKRFMI